MSDIITEWIYYYPPSQILPNNISSIVSDNVGNLQINAILGNSIISGANNVNIVVTPQGFVNWYANNKQYMNNQQNSYFGSIYQGLIHSINGYSNDIEYQSAVLYTEGYYELPYNQAINDLKLVDNSTNNPITKYGLTSSNLYALIKSVSSGTPNTTTLYKSNSGNQIQNNNANSYSYTNVSPYTTSQTQNLAAIDANVVANNTTSQTLTQSQITANTNLGTLTNDLSNIKLPTLPEIVVGLDIYTALMLVGGIIILYGIIKYEGF